MYIACRYIPTTYIAFELFLLDTVACVPPDQFGISLQFNGKFLQKPSIEEMHPTQNNYSSWWRTCMCII